MFGPFYVLLIFLLHVVHFGNAWKFSLQCILRAYVKNKVVEHYSSALSLRACITNLDQMQYYYKPWAFS